VINARQALFSGNLRNAGQIWKCIHVATKNADVNLITRKTYRYFFSSRRQGLGRSLVLLVLLAQLFLPSTSVLADGYELTSVGGALNYSYGYSKTEGTEAENNSVGLQVITNAYIWEPWFATHYMSLSLGFVDSTVKGAGKSTGKTVSGSTDLNIFPVSRFPSYLSFTVSDSVNDSYEQTSFSGHHFTNTRLLFRQSYIGEEDFYSSLNYVQVNTKGEGLESETQNVDLHMRKRLPKHDFDAGVTYLTSDTVGSKSKPEQYSFNGSHSYLPGPSVSINNAMSYHQSQFTGSGNIADQHSEGSQLSSYFSWRPEYRPVSISGGARVSSTENLKDDKLDNTLDSTNYNKDYGANVGASFMLSTRARVTAIATASAGDSDGQTYSNNSVSGSYSYNSDQYLLAGFNYGFGLNATASRQATQSDKELGAESNVESSSGAGVTHRANRSWLVGRASSLNLGLAQGASAQTSGQLQGSGNISHSVSTSLSTHNLRGITFVSISASDSRGVIFSNLAKEGETQNTPISEFQNISLSLSRNYYINRFSNMSGDASYTSNRIHSTSSGFSQTEINNGTRASVRYQHSRIFSVYGMSLDSDITYSNAESKEGRLAEETSFNNKILYSIGQLITSLDLKAAKTAGGPPQYQLYFRATRTF